MRRGAALWVAAALAVATTASPASAEEGENPMFGLNLDLGSGVAYIVDEPFLNLTGLVNLRIWNVQTALTAPVNLSMTSWTVRDEDWDEGRDFQRLIGCARLDLAWEHDSQTGTHDYVEIHRHPMLQERGECDRWPISSRGRYISARLTTIDDVTLGPGHVMDGFTNDLDVDHYNLGAVAEFQGNERVGGTVVLGDITRANVLGGRLYVRPLWMLEQHEGGGGMLNELELGLTAVTDLGAPARTVTAFGGARLVDDYNNLVYTTSEVAVFGFDINWRLNIDDEWFFGLKGEYGFIWDARSPIEDQVGNQGGHVSAGFFWEPPTTPITLDFFGEYRMVGSSYIPVYFDHYYSVQREQFALTRSARDRIDPAFTKLGYLRYLAEEEGGWLEHSYNAVIHFDFWRPHTLEDGTRRLIRFMRLYAWIDHIVGRPSSGSLGMALVFPNILEKITILGMYVRRGFNDVSDLFALEGSFMRFRARWDRIYSGLYLETSYTLRWHLQPDTGFYESAHDFLFNVGFDWDAV